MEKGLGKAHVDLVDGQYIVRYSGRLTRQIDNLLHHRQYGRQQVVTTYSTEAEAQAVCDVVNGLVGKTSNIYADKGGHRQ